MVMTGSQGDGRYDKVDFPWNIFMVIINGLRDYTLLNLWDKDETCRYTKLLIYILW
jgi:hypothetical protein